MTKEELDLIEEAKHGNREAFSKLYNKHYSLIRYVIFDATKDAELTQDLMSITFMKAYSKLHYFVNDFSFSAWLKTIAINTVIDYMRKRNRRPFNVHVDADDSNIQLESKEKNVEEDIIHTEDLATLKEAFAKLRTRYRNLLECKYFKHYSYAEISAELHIPIGTVKSDLNKAKKRLKYFFNQLSNSNKS